ncbi:unnamed protein product [Linum trigynum]|uniref:Uncharacterized protein n=1 Tax=Linum trigynum TaxID=586398 RepID=A0AAV2GHS4_9ROSI
MSTKKLAIRLYDEDDELPAYRGGSRIVWVNREVQEQREGEVRSQSCDGQEGLRMGNKKAQSTSRHPQKQQMDPAPERIKKGRSPRGFNVRKSLRITVGRGINQSTPWTMTGEQPRPGKERAPQPAEMIGGGVAVEKGQLLGRPRTLMPVTPTPRLFT